MGGEVPEVDVGVVDFVEEADRWTLVGVLVRQVEVDDPLALLVGRVLGAYMMPLVPVKSML
jgi:hypothetical protein